MLKLKGGNGNTISVFFVLSDFLYVVIA